MYRLRLASVFVFVILAGCTSHTGLGVTSAEAAYHQNMEAESAGMNNLVGGGKEQIVCVKSARVGSLIKGGAVCLTEKEREKVRQASREVTETAQNRSLYQGKLGM